MRTASANRSALTALITRQLSRAYDRAYRAAERVMEEDEAVCIEISLPLAADFDRAVENGTVDLSVVTYSIQVDGHLDFTLELSSSFLSFHTQGILQDRIEGARRDLMYGPDDIPFAEASAPSTS